MIANDSRRCNGTFASGTTPDDKGKGTTRAFTACKAATIAWEIHYLIVPREQGSGGHYLFGIFAGSPEKEPSDKAREAAGLLRAAVFQVLKH